ncbi:MAG: ThuA domain-containing protein [Bacteroidales bacterium]|nr:ThuA domain-containing protein [Bacteroidales bacterium]
MKKPAVILLLAFGFFQWKAAGQEEEKRILIYTKNGEGYVHENIAASVAALENICAREGILTEWSDQPSVFTGENLKRFDALVFSNSNNEGFDTDEQRKAFQEFIRRGGGFAAIHSANATERDWPWYWALVGGKFLRHPPYQEFDVLVCDSTHPSTRHLPARWTVRDECYYSYQLNPDIHVLLNVDLNTIEDMEKKKYPGETFGHLFPLCWCHEFEGGRQWYTALGHDSQFYEDPLFVEHLRGGLLWILETE